MMLRMHFSAEFRPYGADRNDALDVSGELLVRGHTRATAGMSDRGLVVEAVEVGVLGWTHDLLDELLVESGWRRDPQSPWARRHDDTWCARILPLARDKAHRLQVSIEIPIASEAGARWVARQWLHAVSAASRDCPDVQIGLTLD